MAFLRSWALHVHAVVYTHGSHVLDGPSFGTPKVLDIPFICQTLEFLCLSTETATSGLQNSLCGFKKPDWMVLATLDLVLGTVGF